MPKIIHEDKMSFISTNEAERLRDWDYSARITLVMSKVMNKETLHVICNVLYMI